MRLRLLDQYRDITTDERESITSRHTGKALRRVEFSVTIAAKVADDLNAELNKAEQLEDALLDCRRP